MRIGFFVNDLHTEQPPYATTMLAMAARDLGHEPWYIDVNGFAYDPDDRVRAVATTLPASDKSYRSNEVFLRDLQGENARTERMDVSDLDVLLLRSNPADEMKDRPWAQHVGINFGQMAVQQGVIVLNDPFSLANALNKLYFQFFPEEVRPKSLISRDPAAIKAFVAELDGKAILKPLQGSGGQGVFMVQENEANLNQIIEALSRDGYIVAQAYLPAAAEGDTRLFVMNGEPLLCGGRYCAIRRVNAKGDIRSNAHAGGSIQRAEITDEMLEMVRIIRPKLIRDGMFLVGLDIAGDKLMEVNVFSPGGLTSAQQFEESKFAHTIIEGLEQKTAVVRRYGNTFPNTHLATL